MDENEKKIKLDFYKSFHNNFQNTQNNHVNLLITVFATMITALGEYGYVYTHFNSNNFNELELILSYIIGVFIINTATALVVFFAYNFRRDQLFCAVIREKFKVVENGNNDYAFFPKDWNPAVSYFDKKKYLIFSCIDWMPDFHQILFISLLAFQFLLLISFIIKICNPCIY